MSTPETQRSHEARAKLFLTVSFVFGFGAVIALTGVGEAFVLDAPWLWIGVACALCAAAAGGVTLCSVQLRGPGGLLRQLGEASSPRHRREAAGQMVRGAALKYGLLALLLVAGAHLSVGQLQVVLLAVGGLLGGGALYLATRSKRSR